MSQGGSQVVVDGSRKKYSLYFDRKYVGYRRKDYTIKITLASVELELITSHASILGVGGRDPIFWGWGRGRSQRGSHGVTGGLGKNIAHFWTENLLESDFLEEKSK